jgi:hypothetical protein
MPNPAFQESAAAPASLAISIDDSRRRSMSVATEMCCPMAESHALRGLDCVLARPDSAGNLYAGRVKASAFLSRREQAIVGIVKEVQWSNLAQ